MGASLINGIGRNYYGGVQNIENDCWEICSKIFLPKTHFLIGLYREIIFQQHTLNHFLINIFTSNVA